MTLFTSTLTLLRSGAAGRRRVTLDDMDIRAIKAKLAILGKNAEWLTTCLSLKPGTVAGWFSGKFPPPPYFTVCLEIELAAGEITPVNFSLIEYLDIEISAKSLNMSVPQVIAHSIRKSLGIGKDSVASKPTAPYEKFGNVIVPNFGKLPD